MRIRLWIAAALAVVVFVPRPVAGAPPAAGQHSRWHLVFRAGLQGQAGAQPGAVSLEGEWLRTVVVVTPESYDVRYQLLSLRVTGGSGAAVDPKALAAATARLSTPFWVTCGRDGALQTMHFAKAMSASDRNLLQTIATETQFVQADGALPVWTAMERDGGGSYMAIYQRRDAEHVRKKKIKYVGPDADIDRAGAALELTVESSDVTFALTADGAVASVNGIQSIRLGVPGTKNNSLVTRVEVHLSDPRTSLAPVTAATLMPTTGIDDVPVMTQQSDPAEALADMDAQMLEGHRTAAILDAAGNGDSTSDRRLVALLRRRPDAVPLAVARLGDDARRGRAAGTDAAAQALLGALAAAGTAPAIEALHAVARDAARPVTRRVGALMALEGIREPSVMAMRAPASLLDDPNPKVREAARLATGALARAGRAGHSVDADGLEADLVVRLTRATTPETRRAYLAALGNSAGPRAAEAITDALRDGHEEVRVSAARGLRLVPGEAADALLAATAASDASAEVRGAALFAIGFRLPFSTALWRAVVDAARTDAAEPVRNRAVGLLRADTAHRAEAASTLAWVAGHDPSPALRRLAAGQAGPQRRADGMTGVTPP